MNPNAWKDTADAAGGCLGGALKHNGKTGEWTLNGVSIEAVLVAIIMPTALHGEICFVGEGRAPDPAPGPLR